MTNDRQVVMTIIGGRVTLPARCEPALRELLTCREAEFEAVAGGGWRRAERAVPLYRVAGGEVAVPSPLAGLALLALERAGYAVRLDGGIPWPSRLVPAAPRWRRADEPEAALLLQALGNHEVGLVLSTPGWKPHHVVRLLAEAYPRARIAVGASTRADAERLCGRLRALGKRLHRDDPWTSGHAAPVTVLTLGRLDHSMRQDFDLLIASDAAAAAAPSLDIMGGQWEGVPGYAVLRPGQHLSHAERLRLAARFGPAVIDLGQAGRPTLRLTTVHAPWRPMPVANSPIEWRRSRVWRNAPRNELVARLARAAAEQRADELDRLGVPAWTGPAAPRVAVLADALEQARELAKLLPGWPVWSADGPAPSTPKPATPSRVIVTLAALARGVKLDADVLVNGTLADVLSLPGLDLGRGCAAQVIDLIDSDDGRLAQHAREKLAAYRRAGLAANDLTAARPL